MIGLPLARRGACGGAARAGAGAGGAAAAAGAGAAGLRRTALRGGRRDAAPARRRAARHRQRARAQPRARAVRPARRGRPRGRRDGLLGRRHAASTTPARRRRSSTGRTPRACCPVEEWPLVRLPSPLPTAPRASAGTRCRPTRWIARCATSCAPRGRSRPPSSAAPRRAASGGTGRSRRSRVEWLLDLGEVVCVRRVGWRRVYDLAERAIPESTVRTRRRPAGSTTTASPGPTTTPACASCSRGRSASAASARSPTSSTSTASAASAVPRARARAPARRARRRRARSGASTVQGWKGTAYADAAGLDALAAGELGGRSRTTLLSPFDSLVWHRGRTVAAVRLRLPDGALRPAGPARARLLHDAGAARRAARGARRPQAREGRADRAPGDLRGRAARRRARLGRSPAPRRRCARRPAGSAAGRSRSAGWCRSRRRRR